MPRGLPGRRVSVGIFGLFALTALVFGLAAMRPEAYHVERSVTIQAPATAIYAMLSDLSRFDEWSPWVELDPEMKKASQGPGGR